MLESPPAAGSPVMDAYGRHVDGLFTYCLSVLCEHDAAVASMIEVRDLALRYGDRPADPALRRAWLYALARHCCLRRLEGAPVIGAAGPDGGRTRPPGSPRGSGPRPGPRPETGDGAGAGDGAWAARGPAAAAVVAQRRAELSRLAWPEAAGTGPDQREALELAVRHRLPPAEVAAVLGITTTAAETLLDTAGTEVCRTRTALLVLGVGSCPELARLGGVGAESWRSWVLGPALRRELVQHVVDCPTCRGTADRVGDELEHGLSGLPGLPLLPAPVTVRVGTTPGQVPDGAAGAAFLAGAAAGRRLAASAGGRPAVRFDQRGFPRHRVAPGGRPLVRQRVVTAGVLAAVLTAPVVALWAAHRGGGEGSSAAPVSSVRVSPGSDATDRAGQEPTGPEAGARPWTDVQETPGADGLAAELQLAGAVREETLLPLVDGAAVPVPSTGSAPLSRAPLTPGPPPAPPAEPAGRLTVEAGELGSRTVITLTNSGGAAIRWHAVVDADWLRLSRDDGTLEPGQRITVTVTVDEERAPDARWTARIALPPSEAVVTLEGGPSHRSGESGGPGGPGGSETGGGESGGPGSTGSTGGPSGGPSDPGQGPAPDGGTGGGGGGGGGGQGDPGGPTPGGTAPGDADGNTGSSAPPDSGASTPSTSSTPPADGRTAP